MPKAAMESIRYLRAKDRHAADGPLDLAPLVGTWIATDETTGGIVKVLVSEIDGGLAVHAFGACEPEPCDWGRAATAEAYATSPAARDATGFTAHYDFGFLRTRLEANLGKGLLIIAAFNTFHDESGRADYFSRTFFHYQPAPAAA